MSSHPSKAPDPAIRLCGVTKTYAIWDDPSARLVSLLRRMMGFGQTNASNRSFTAVHEIDLVIARGECLGIIGRNGAGKSTLLQMIAGTLQPTKGSIEVNGRVAALLELGSGFNPDFTGRENIHLNAAILGLTKPEIAAKFDAIVAYSGIEEFIDRPVRTYSSGMTLRLAFSVCVHVDADILIIDEALAVGDARFQFKCHATLDQLLKDGRTIIFVSHDTNSVKRLCDTSILLERGEVLLKGSPNDVTNIYTKLITSPLGVEAIRADILALQQRDLTVAPATAVVLSAPTTTLEAPPTSIPSEPATSLVGEERAHRQISDKEYAYGGELGQIVTVQLTDAQGQPHLSFISGSSIRVRFTCEANAEISKPIYALTIKNVNGQEIFGTNTYFQNQTTPTVCSGTLTEAVFDLELNVLPGVYFISIGWVCLSNAEVQVIHRRYDVLRFDVLPHDQSFGIAYCPTKITVKTLTR